MGQFFSDVQLDVRCDEYQEPAELCEFCIFEPVNVVFPVRMAVIQFADELRICHHQVAVSALVGSADVILAQRRSPYVV